MSFRVWSSVPSVPFEDKPDNNIEETRAADQPATQPDNTPVKHA